MTAQYHVEPSYVVEIPIFEVFFDGFVHFSIPSLRLGQSKGDTEQYEVGDKVEVDFFGDWIDGVVVDVRKVNVRVKFQHPTMKREIEFPFRGEKIRLKAKKISDSKVRTWKSKSGAFSMEASLEELTKSKVKLRRKSDSKLLEVDIAKLSEEDQQYLESLSKGLEEDPFDKVVESGPPPEKPTIPDRIENRLIEELEIPIRASARPIDSSEPKRWSVAAEKLAEPVELTEKIKIENVSSFKRIVRVAFTNDQSRALVLLRNIQGASFQRRAYVVDLADGKLVGDFPPQLEDTKFDDISPDGRFLVSRSDARSSFARIDLWKIGDGKLERYKGWELPDASRPGRRVTIARFAGKNRVITTDSFRLKVWQVEPLELLMEYDQAIGIRDVVVSADGNQIAFVQGGEVVVINLDEAAVVGRAKTESGSGAVAISNDGKVAYVGDRSIRIWSSTGKLLDHFAIRQRNNGDRMAFWVDNRFLVVSAANETAANVFDTTYRVWLSTYKYISDENGQIDSRGRLWIVRGSEDDAVLGTTQLNFKNSLHLLPENADELLWLKSGDKVQIDIKLPFLKADKQKVRDHFESQFEANGIGIADESEIKLNLRSTVGEKYNIALSGFLSPVWSARRKIEVKPITLTATLQNGDDVIWQSSARRTLPMILHIKKDQSVQEAANAATMPKAESYLSMQLPLHIAKQPKQGPYGIIQLGLNGIANQKYAEPAVPENESDF